MKHNEARMINTTLCHGFGKKVIYFSCQKFVFSPEKMNAWNSAGCKLFPQFSAQAWLIINIHEIIPFFECHAHDRHKISLNVLPICCRDLFTVTQCLWVTWNLFFNLSIVMKIDLVNIVTFTCIINFSYPGVWWTPWCWKIAQNDQGSHSFHLNHQGFT